MSDFVMVIPPGWIEFPEANDLINTGATPPGLVYSQISGEAWGDMDTFLSSAGLLPEGKNVTSARMVQTDNGYRLWVQFNI